MDLVLTKTVAKHPNVRIILSHAGGTLPFLSDRVVKSMDIPQVQNAIGHSSSDTIRDFQSFYLDVAVSTSR